MRSLSCLAGVVGLFAAVVNASLNPIVVKGNAFFDSVTGKRFYIRGVDYQVSSSSILRNADLSPVDLLL
jgi:1,3-beta-glucanosyltransferase GAS5